MIFISPLHFSTPFFKPFCFGNCENFLSYKVKIKIASYMTQIEKKMENMEKSEKSSLYSCPLHLENPVHTTLSKKRN